MYGLLVFLNILACEFINPKPQNLASNSSKKTEAEEESEPSMNNEPITPTMSEDNPIQSIAFSENGSPCILVNLKNTGKFKYSLYKSSTPDKANSFTWSHIITPDDVEMDDNVAKILIPKMSEEEKKYVYCLAINEKDNMQGKDPYFSEPFEYSSSQKKYMLSRVAKDHKNTGGITAAWIAIGLAIAAFVIVVAFVLYKLLC